TVAQCGKPLKVKWTIESQEGPEKQPMYLYQGDNEENLKRLLTITEACNLKNQKLQYTLPTNLATDNNYAVCDALNCEIGNRIGFETSRIVWITSLTSSLDGRASLVPRTVMSINYFT
ncbi:31867_t:CDS:2, partial [Racocetra persica]